MMNVLICPQCKSAMHNRGKEFKPPRRNNIRQWRKVELLYQRGYRWETKFKQVSTTWKNINGEKPKPAALIKVECTVPVSRSPRALTLRDAKTDYPPQA